MRAAARHAVVALLVSAFDVRAAPVSRPPPGRHGVTLCVAAAPAQPSCGPAQADLRRDGSWRVSIDDLVYRLQLHSSQVDVVLTHGAVQIDAFTAPYEWLGSALRFNDDSRNARYEIRFPHGPARTR